MFLPNIIVIRYFGECMHGIHRDLDSLFTVHLFCGNIQILKLPFTFYYLNN